jgi:hypothetical protein
VNLQPTANLLPKQTTATTGKNARFRMLLNWWLNGGVFIGFEVFSNGNHGEVSNRQSTDKKLPSYWQNIFFLNHKYCKTGKHFRTGGFGMSSLAVQSLHANRPAKTA